MTKEQAIDLVAKTLGYFGVGTDQKNPVAIGSYVLHQINDHFELAVHTRHGQRLVGVYYPKEGTPASDFVNWLEAHVRNT
jgi:hypothetical protein